MSTARARKIGRKPARVERFAGHHRNAARAPHLGQRFDVLGLTRLLEPVGLELGERIGEIDGVHRRQAAVDVEQQVDVRTDRVAHRAHDLHGAPDVLLRDVRAPGARHRVELHRGEPALDHGLGSARVVLRLLHLVAPAVRVDANARAAGTAEEIVDRLLGGLADDVPQRLLDAGGGAIEFQRAAPLRVVVERDLQDVTDLERIAPDQIAAELLDLCGDGAVAVILAVGFAPPDDPGIGLDAHEDEVLAPAGMDRKAFDAGDFHRHPITSLRLQGSTPMLIERPSRRQRSRVMPDMQQAPSSWRAASDRCYARRVP